MGGLEICEVPSVRCVRKVLVKGQQTDGSL